MSTLLAFAMGLSSGVTMATFAVVLVMRRARRAAVRDLVARVGPVLERRAALLGLAEQLSPQVGLGTDGEFVIARGDALARLLQMADAIEVREQSQLGYQDTMRVSKEEVEARVEAARRGG